MGQKMVLYVDISRRVPVNSPLITGLLASIIDTLVRIVMVSIPPRIVLKKVTQKTK